MIKAMVHSAIDKKDKALTFRRGEIGNWRDEFNDKHKKLFKTTDKNEWLIRLGYETGPAW